MDEKRRESVELYTNAISVRTDPKGSGEVSGQAMGHARPGQGPVIRDVPKSACRLAHPRRLSLRTALPIPVVSVGDVGTAFLLAGGGAGAGNPIGCPQFGGGHVRRDGSQATEAVRGARHGDTTMRKCDHPALRAYDDYIASALRTECGHLPIGRGGFILCFAGGPRLSGYDCEPIKAYCIAAGLPVIDSRMLAFEEVVHLAVRGPMVAVGESPSPQPYHALSYVPLAAVASAYRAAGNEVHAGSHDDISGGESAREPLRFARPQ